MKKIFNTPGENEIDFQLMNRVVFHGMKKPEDFMLSKTSMIEFFVMTVIMTFIIIKTY